MSWRIFSVAAVPLALLAAPAAQAAQTLTITGPSGTFTNDDVTCTPSAMVPCSFTNTFTFTTPVGFDLVSLDISSVATSNPLTNIDFSSVTFNGTPFAPLSTGISEFRNLLSRPLTAGATNTLTIVGTTGGNASYSGNIAFATSGVPEPATWAMMLVAFASAGFVLRRRPRVASRVAFG